MNQQHSYHYHRNTNLQQHRCNTSVMDTIGRTDGGFLGIEDNTLFVGTDDERSLLCSLFWFITQSNRIFITYHYSCHYYIQSQNYCPSLCINILLIKREIEYGFVRDLLTVDGYYEGN